MQVETEIAPNLNTVPLRGGAMQSHACAYYFYQKYFFLHIERRDTVRFPSTIFRTETWLD
jgi:hypothetical protein